MARREWGLLCPEGHGPLIQREEWNRQGVAWCPHEDHGGNGRFWRTTEAGEGWFDPSAEPVITEAQRERNARATERAAEWAAERTRRMAEVKKPKEPRVKAAKETRDCLCGCGGQTKGGRFLPGHDARYHARVKQALAAGKTHAEAEELASKGPLPASISKAATNGNGAGTDVKATKPVAAAKPKRAKQPDLTAKADEAPVADDITI